MKKQNFSLIVSLLLVCTLTACFSSKTSENQAIVFLGDPKIFVLQPDEVPVGWNLKEAGADTFIEIPHWTVVYKPVVPDQYTQSTITQYVYLLEDTTVAEEKLKEYYESELVRRSDKLLELPEEYNYTSSVADDLYIFYSKNDLLGPVMGYNYEVSARYGNIICDIHFVIEGVEPTDVKKGQANIVTWAEVRDMLKLIDGKFQKAVF